MILITGGTGFIGSYLVEKLLKEGREVRLLVRNPKKIKWKVEHVVGDITDRRSVREALRDADGVYHLAAIFRHGVNPSIIWKANYQGTVNLIEEALRQNVEKFLHVSTVGVIGYANSKPLDETAPYKPNPNAYSQSKAKAEEYVLQMHKEHGIDVRVIRPAFVYGIGNTYGLNLLIDTVAKGKLKWVIGDGSNYIHPIHVLDLVDAITTVMEKGGSGEIYIAANESPVTLRDFLDLVAKLSGRKVRYGFPPTLARLILRLRGGIGDSSAEETILAFTKNWFYSVEKLKSLGWRQRMGLEDGVREVIEWLFST